jgi:hypothetical protein
MDLPDKFEVGISTNDPGLNITETIYFDKVDKSPPTSELPKILFALQEELEVVVELQGARCSLLYSPAGFGRDQSAPVGSPKKQADRWLCSKNLTINRFLIFKMRFKMDLVWLKQLGIYIRKEERKRIRISQ